jgi:hypothetical protein
MPRIILFHAQIAAELVPTIQTQSRGLRPFAEINASTALCILSSFQTQYSYSGRSHHSYIDSSVLFSSMTHTKTRMATHEINEINSPRYVPSPFGHGKLESKSQSIMTIV